MAVRFDADGEDYSVAGLSIGTAYTCICWGKISVDRDDNGTFFSLSNGTTHMAIQTDADGVTIDRQPSTNVAAGGPVLTVGVWYALAYSQTDTSNGTIYSGTSATGLSSVAASMTNMPSSFTTLLIGESGFGLDWLNGCVANMKLYSVALTQAEIELELSQYVPKRTADLVCWYPFLIGTDTADYSGNGRTLTSTGGTPTTEDGPSIPWGDSRPYYVADRGSVANATAGTTSSITLSSPTAITIGNYLIARVAVDNSGSSGAAPGFTVTDPRSNTWTILGPALADPGAAAAGATAYIGYTRVTTAYQAADALTFNWGGVSTTAKACVVEEWGNISSATPVAVSAVTNDSGAAASTTAVAATIVPTAANQLVYTCLATEGIAGDSITYDSDTTSGFWVALTRTASANATATNNQCVAGQFKTVTAAGSQTWNATITSRDWAAVAVVFGPPVVAPQLRLRPVAQQLGALLQM